MKNEENRENLPSLSSGKTYPEYSAAEITLSDVFLQGLPAKAVNWNHQGENGQTLVMCWDQKGLSAGECSTLNFSEWPNDAAVCLLSQALEGISIPQKFFLSPKACAGILRRAEKRGRALPQILGIALLTVVTGMGRIIHIQPSTSHIISEG